MDNEFSEDSSSQISPVLIVLKQVFLLQKLHIVLLLGLLTTTGQAQSSSSSLTESSSRKSVVSETTLPVTAAGNAMRSFILRYNSGKLDDPRWARWYSLYGPVEVKSVEVSEPSRIEVWTQGTLTRGWINFSLRLDPNNLQKSPDIGVIVLGGAPPPHLDSAPVLISSKEIAREAKQYLKKLSEADFFSGVVLIAENGNIIFQKAYGLASVPYKIPNQLDTKFNLASLSKVFTAAAIARLVQQGKLNYTDTVERYLPNYPVESVKKASIHQLLTHTSGIGRASRDWISDRFISSLDELIASTVAEPEFKPGENARYNNEAWLLLGKIIETVSGNSYEEFLRNQIFVPSGMKNTGFLRWDEEPPNTATPYTFWRFTNNGQVFEPGQRHSAVQMQGIKGTPAGGAFSTAPDLLLFANGLLNNTLLNSTQVELMMKPHVAGGPNRFFGYGMEVSQNGRIAGKGGGSQGVSTMLQINPQRKFVIIVLSNYDGISQLAANHLNRLIGEK